MAALDAALVKPVNRNEIRYPVSRFRHEFSPASYGPTLDNAVLLHHGNINRNARSSGEREREGKGEQENEVLWPGVRNQFRIYHRLKRARHSKTGKRSRPRVYYAAKEAGKQRRG